MQGLPNKDTCQICAGGTWYSNRRTLSDLGGGYICGRFTRICKVSNGGKRTTSYALKDDGNNDTGVAVWGRLLRLKGKVEPGILGAQFVALVQAPGDGAMTVGDFMKQSTSSTHNMGTKEGDLIHTLDLSLPISADPHVVARHSRGNGVFIRSVPDAEHLVFNVSSKRNSPFLTHKRNRSVHKEVCTAYHDQENIQVMLRTLKHIVKVLHVMWGDAKAIHCDINTGNILYDGVCGRLGDLEVVKFVEDTNTLHDVKTGTAEFMAIEVAAGQYIFESEILPPTKPLLSRSAARSRRLFCRDYMMPSASALPADAPESTSQLPFRRNFLHDLESIWWLMLWTMFRHYPDGLEFDEKVLARQFSSYVTLFPGPCGDKTERILTFTTKRTAYGYLRTIAPPLAAIGSLAFELRAVLVGCYMQGEAHLPITPDCDAFRDLHLATIFLIQDMMDLMTDNKFEKVVTVHHLLLAPKREAEGTQDNASARKDHSGNMGHIRRIISTRLLHM